MVPKSDVRWEGPFAAPEPARTGAPGRPTSMQLILDEFERRIEAGNVTTGVASQASELRHWIVTTHPYEPHPTAKTIENRIRERYRQAQKP
jgi:hypothetical protein